MELNGFKEFCYTGNYGDIMISGIDSAVILELSKVGSGDLLLSESYEPDQKGIIRIGDIGRVLQTHIALPELNLSGSMLSLLVVRFHLKGSDGGTLFDSTQRVAYSRGYAVFGDDGQEYDRFISRYSIKETNERRTEFVSFFHNGQIFSYAIAYVDGNGVKAVEHKTTACAVEDVIESKLFSLGEIVRLAQEELNLTIVPANVIYYDAILYKDDVVIDRIRFKNNTVPRLHEVSFLFYNLLGVPETVSFTGKEETSDEVNGEYGYFQGNYRKYSQQIVEPKKINSGYIDRQTLVSVRDMLSSPTLVLYEDDTLKDEVVITDADFKRKAPSAAPTSVTITYRKASRLQEEFNRPDYDDMIFFDTFDVTFV